jgi:hypothetical protein
LGRRHRSLFTFANGAAMLWACDVMTMTLRRALGIGILMMLSGALVYEARKISVLAAQIQDLRHDQTVLSEQNENSTRERDAALKKLAIVRDYVGVLQNQTAEVPRLRGEVSRLRSLRNEAELSERAQNVRAASALPAWEPNHATNVGRGSPQDALQTYIWSGMNTNSSELALCVIPDEKDPPDASSIQKIVNNPREQIFKGLLEMRQLSQTPISANEVLLEFTGRPGPDLEITRAVTLRKIDDDWRLVLFNQRDADGKITHVAPWVLLSRP